MKNLYNLNLNEVADIGSATVRRVPGGWIYYTEHSAVFVPYNEEFKEKDVVPVDANNWPAGINKPVPVLEISTSPGIDIMVRGFKVIFPGEESAGIREETFEVPGPFYFESLQDMNSLANGLSDVFAEYAGQRPYIRTWEELQEK